MDDPRLAWPFWKFGMKKNDLSTKLQDQYNTITSSIQDPEAFHHDVYEISRLADTTNDFHRLMADRKEQRLKELNASLDLAAVEIIANPTLVGTAQWSHALQLFRTRSLDSLVRLFSSYLPHGYRCGQGYYTASSTGSSLSDGCSTRTASTNLSSLDDVDCPTFVHDDEKGIITQEPLDISTSILSSALAMELPPSPRSMTMLSETSASSPIDADTDHDDDVLHNLTPSRMSSFSGSESGRFTGRVLQCLDDEQEISQAEDPCSLTTSVSDLENRSTRESTVEEEQVDYTYYPDSGIEDGDYDEDFSTTQIPVDLLDDDVMESAETPTPKPEMESPTNTMAAAFFLDNKTYNSLRLIPTYTFRNTSQKIHRRRRDASPAKTSTRSCSISSGSRRMMNTRRSPEEAVYRIQKSQPDAIRGARALASKECRRELDIACMAT